MIPIVGEDDGAAVIIRKLDTVVDPHAVDIDAVFVAQVPFAITHLYRIMCSLTVSEERGGRLNLGLCNLPSK